MELKGDGMLEQDYASREQMWVKHWMLERYLELLILKVGRRWKRFVYIDGYAGPWGSQRQDLSDTSFGRAIDVMRKCQQKLAEQGVNIPMKAVFFEKHKLRAARLRQYAEEHSTPSLEIRAFHADFMGRVNEVAEKLTDQDFAFALIDPTGYRDMVPANLAPLLRKRGVEVLINLMWDFINRAWNFADVAGTLDEIFGSDRHEKCSEHDLERSAARHYIERLRSVAGSKGGRLRAATFPVQHPSKDRTHYFLVYATHAAIGLLTFDKVAAMTWQQQALTKAKAKLRSHSEVQGDIFGCEIHDVQAERFVDKDEARRAWLSRFPVAGSEIIVSDDLMAELLETCSCFCEDLHSAARDLINSGVLENVSVQPAQLKRRSKNVVQNGEVLRRLR